MAITADYSGPTCPTDCSNAAIGAVVFNDCPEAQDVELSEIEELYVTIDNAGAANGGPTDWTSPTDWATALDQSTADKVRKLTVVGNLTKGEPVYQDLPQGKRKLLYRNYTLNFNVIDLNDTTRTELTAWQCGKQIRFWPKTQGSRLYGGQTGILAEVDGGLVLDSGRESTARWEGTITWQSKFDPPSIDSPI